MTATDGEWLQDKLHDAAAAKRRLLLPTEKPIKISRMVVNDGVPLGIDPEARGPAVIRWTAKEPGAMMELRCANPSGQMFPQYFILERIRFDGGGIASALQSWSGFTKGATLNRCHFWNCVGPVVHMRSAWCSTLSDLMFSRCKGGLIDFEGHHSHNVGIVDAIDTGRCEANGDGRPAMRFTGSCGSISNISLDSWTHYPGLPLILLDGCESKGIMGVRAEGGGDWGVEGYSIVELRNCKGCGVEKIRGVFSPAHPGHCVVRVVGGEKNYLLGIRGGRAGTLEAGGVHRRGDSGFGNPQRNVHQPRRKAGATKALPRPPPPPAATDNAKGERIVSEDIFYCPCGKEIACRLVCTRLKAEKARAEKAEREADRVRAVALKQYEYALEESARLRDASLPVAAQLDEPMVEGADKSQCRLVPAGLLLTLREALRARLGEAASDPATPAQRPGSEGKAARPKWCSHADCGFLIGWQNTVCGGRLPAPVRHEDDFNTHRICFKLPAEVLDLQVNRNDCWLIGLVTQKLREDGPPARDSEVPAQGEEADDGEAKG